MYNRLTKVDGAMLGDHYYLNASDYCTFMGEYTPAAPFSFTGHTVRCY